MTTAATSSPPPTADPTCRLCGGTHLECRFRNERAPANISRLLRPGEALGPSVTLEVFECADCGLVQLTREPQRDFYEDYLMTVSHSPRMRAYQNEQVNRFVRRFGLRGKRVVEAGCGDGHYLALLSQAGVDAAGLEPSGRFREEAIRRGQRVVGGYVSAASPVPGGPYDAFVTRQVLEHVPHPIDFLRGLLLSITPSGVGLVEVPSLEQALATGRFYDFFADHLSYFSAGTLARALERSGFFVLEVTRGMDGEYLEAWVEASLERNFGDLNETAGALVADLRALLARGGSVAVWGAGAKGLTTLVAAGATGVRYVIDSDPHKQGLRTPVLGLPIVPPAHLATEPVETVVVTAMAYRDEIVSQLRETLGFPGEILVLGRRLVAA